MKSFKQFLFESVRPATFSPTGWGVKKPGKEILPKTELKIEQIILADVKVSFFRSIGITASNMTMITINPGKYVLIYTGRIFGLGYIRYGVNIVHPITHKNLSDSLTFSSNESKFYFPK